MKLSAFSLASFTAVTLVVTFHVLPVSGHGRLWDPPARSTMWRLGYNTPVNYDDNQLFCGGFGHQMDQGYRCGVCGDPYDGPRLHEAGGIYATGTIADTYVQGQLVTLKVELTANHKGFFEFRICPTNSPYVNASQECLNRRPLQLADGRGTQFPIDFAGPRMVEVTVYLPSDLTCDFCVIQWRYHTGNSWGTNQDDGRSCVGCGFQEEFYGCADVEILPDGDGNGRSTAAPATTTTRSTSRPRTTTTTTTTTTTAPRTNRPRRTTTTTTTTTVRPPQGHCRSLSRIPAYDQWCEANCARNYCPDQLCTCGPSQRLSCWAVGAYRGNAGMDAWCLNNCSLDHCPLNLCRCVYSG